MSLTAPQVIFGIAALGTVLYQVFVTARLIRFGGYSFAQKVMQSLFIWFVPLLGACIVYFVLRTTEKALPRQDRDFTPQGPQSVG